MIRRFGIIIVILLSCISYVNIINIPREFEFNEFIYSVKKTLDKGLIMVGVTSFRNLDILIIKMNSKNSIEWSKAIGTLGKDVGYSIEVLGNGYLIAGYTSTTEIGGYNILLIKLDLNGNVIWSKALGTERHDIAYSVVKAHDNGFLIVGYTLGFRGDSDILLAKFDNNGNILWCKVIGEKLYDDVAKYVLATKDGGYLIVGHTWSSKAELDDAFVMKLNASGDIEWYRNLGGCRYDEACYAIETSDKGYLLIGTTWSYGFGSEDILILKLNSSGYVEWSLAMGGEECDGAYSAIEINDGYLINGFTFSFTKGGYDAMLIKINKSGYIDWFSHIGHKGDESLYSIVKIGKSKYVILGYTSSFGLGDYDVLFLNIENEYINSAYILKLYNLTKPVILQNRSLLINKVINAREFSKRVEVHVRIPSMEIHDFILKVADLKISEIDYKMTINAINLKTFETKITKPFRIRITPEQLVWILLLLPLIITLTLTFLIRLFSSLKRIKKREKRGKK